MLIIFLISYFILINKKILKDIWRANPKIAKAFIVVNKEEKKAAIDRGEAGLVDAALENAKIARAMAHENKLARMNLRQVTGGARSATSC